MRIAIVTTSYPKEEADPAGHFVRTEARALVKGGHEVVVFTPDGHATNDHIDIIGVRTFGAFGWPGAAERLIENPARVFGVARWMRRTGAALRHAGPFDRVIAHWALPSALLVPDDSELWVVSHGGDVRALIGMPAPMRNWFVQRIARRASNWRFVSVALRDQLVDILDEDIALSVKRISHIAPSPIDLPDVGARARELRAAARLPLICSVGRLIATKRIDRVLAHAARAHVGKRLIVIGDGPERARLERLAHSGNLDVRFMGLLPRDETLAWIAASEALLFASEVEGFPTVVREAEALGVRVERIGLG